jgi:hypothetical protein
MITRIREVPYFHSRSAGDMRAERRTAQEIPLVLVLGLGALKR